MEKYSSEINSFTLPLLSRIYTTENFPHILTDNKAIELKDKLPKEVRCISKLLQYTMLSGAIRSRKVDMKVDDFLVLNPDGIVAVLGCSSSTAFYRSSTPNKWYEIDSPEIIKYKKMFYEPDINNIYLESDIFDKLWFEKIRNANPSAPILVICCGIFNYHKKTKVEELLRYLARQDNVEIIFDAVNYIGKKRMSKYYKHIGITNTKELFYVGKLKSLKKEIHHNICLDDEPFFENVQKSGFKTITRIYMKIADLFKMINLYHIKSK